MPSYVAGRIEDVTLSKKKTSLRVRIGDEWFGAYMPKKDEDDIQSALGKMIVADWEDKGNYGKWISRWRFSQDQTLPEGSRPITPHQGAVPRELPADFKSSSTLMAKPAQQHEEPARQLSAEELKVVNGIVMAAIQHADVKELDHVQLWMKGIAATVREM